MGFDGNGWVLFVFCAFWSFSELHPVSIIAAVIRIKYRIFHLYDWGSCVENLIKVYDTSTNRCNFFSRHQLDDFCISNAQRAIGVCVVRSKSSNDDLKTREQLSKDIGVSPSAIDRAAAVEKLGEDKAEQVRHGKTTASTTRKDNCADIIIFVDKFLNV